MGIWGLRATRAAALTLIALPEPFTTPIGLAALVGVSLMARRRQGQVLKAFEHELRGHLRQAHCRHYRMLSSEQQAMVWRRATDTGAISRRYGFIAFRPVTVPPATYHHTPRPEGSLRRIFGPGPSVARSAAGVRPSPSTRRWPAKEMGRPRIWRAAWVAA